MSITLVAGLGNPGREYEATRHNIGWVVIEAFARKHGLSWKPSPQFEAEVARWDAGGRTIYLLKPLTYMNDSARAVSAMARFYKVPLASIIAIYDDLNIELGLVKVSIGGSAGGHNGVASLIGHFGEAFVRYRLGIGPKEPSQMDLKDFVLGKFTPAQHTLITQQLDHYITGLDLLLNRGADAAMNQLNRRDPK
ncbi:MAG: aminoacyl-tRNA hydrolase [Verrucomicrobia bacterium]|nr:aminoacyl-tRNA hydrolase [Verrucomicrobiota bacterium]